MAEPITRRWQAQRWLIDNIIRTVGMDFDQNRSGYLAGPCGPEAAGDFQIIRQRIQKLADFAPTFETAARRREERARAAEGQGRPVTAREHYFTAAIQWGAAQWTIAENNDTNRFYNQRKVECYGRYAHLADHHVERVLIPFRDKALPAWFHLPPDYRDERVPTIVAIPGMDSFKETSVTLHGDRWLTRGCAVLALDGPGQYESPVLGVYVTVQNWVDAARIVFDWVAARPEVDVDRVGVIGNSFGSLFGTIVAGAEPRYRACAVSGVIHEPGCHTIFEEASPTFKQRFMYMAQIADEAAFDKFRQTLSYKGHAEKIKMPYLIIGGESDELCPLRHVDEMLLTMKGPRQFVVYQDSRHAVGGVPAATLGPFLPSLISDWVAARIADKPFASEKWFVDATGKVTR